MEPSMEACTTRISPFASAWTPMTISGGWWWLCCLLVLGDGCVVGCVLLCVVLFVGVGGWVPCLAVCTHTWATPTHPHPRLSQSEIYPPRLFPFLRKKDVPIKFPKLALTRPPMVSPKCSATSCGGGGVDDHA